MEVTVSQLTKVYPGRITALDGVNLAVGTGMFGLLGPNGAGKTTLMRIICTLLPPTAGQVQVGGYDLARHPNSIRRLLGYLPQEFGVYRALTGFEFLDYIAGLKGLRGPDRRRHVLSALEQVHLSDAARRPCGAYSGGMKRRLGIAQALLGSPRLLVVDEPTAGLDPEERVRFRNLLADLSGTRVIILSTHVVADVESTCSRLAVLDRGRIRFAGSPEELVARAEGRVWELDLDPAAYEAERTRLRVVASRRGDGRVWVRVVARDNPLGAGRLAAPGLEEGYLWLMEGEPA